MREQMPSFLSCCSFPLSVTQSFETSRSDFVILILLLFFLFQPHTHTIDRHTRDTSKERLLIVVIIIIIISGENKNCHEACILIYYIVVVIIIVIVIVAESQTTTTTREKGRDYIIIRRLREFRAFLQDFPRLFNKSSSLNREASNRSGICGFFNNDDD